MIRGGGEGEFVMRWEIIQEKALIQWIRAFSLVGERDQRTLMLMMEDQSLWPLGPEQYTLK